MIRAPGGSDGKESPCSVRDSGLIPGSGRIPGEGNGIPLQFLTGEFHGRRLVHGVANKWPQLSN